MAGERYARWRVVADVAAHLRNYEIEALVADLRLQHAKGTRRAVFRYGLATEPREQSLVH
jgi:hypothetical protein